LAKLEALVLGSKSKELNSAAWICRFGYNRATGLTGDDAPEGQKAMAMIKSISSELVEDVFMKAEVSNFAKAANYADFLAGIVQDRGVGYSARGLALAALGDAKALTQLDKIAADRAVTV